MRHVIRNIVNFTKLNRDIKRYFHLSRIRNMEEDQRTTVTFLNRDATYGIMVDSVNEWGFILNTGTFVYGPAVIFPKTLLSWNVRSSNDINEDSLSLFLALEPKLDVLVIGLETDHAVTSPVVQGIRKLLVDAKINHEILYVKKAVSAFNFLNSDGRYIAAALIPPKLNEIVTKSNI